MKTRYIAVVLYVLVLLFSYIAEAESDYVAEQSNDDLTVEQKAAVERFFANQSRPQNDSRISEPDTSEPEALPETKFTKPSGEWVNKDGALLCDGFLTRNETEDHCSAEIPGDWQQMVFNGKVYYVQPLM